MIQENGRNRRRTSKRTYMMRRVVFLLLCVAVVLLVVFGIRALVRAFSGGGKKTDDGPVYTAAIYEANPDGPSAEMLLTPQGQAAMAQGASIVYMTDPASVSFSKPGVYTLQTEYTAPDGTRKKYTTKLTVRDTTAPTGSGVDLTVPLGETREISDFIRDVRDVTDVAVTWIREPDFTRAGTQNLEILLRDTSGNETRLTAVLTVTDGKDGSET